MQIEYIEVSKVVPYENNPRHNEEAIEKVADSIVEYGFRNPIIVDKDNVIICGHTRYQAALTLKLNKVPVIKAEDLTPAQVKAYRIADNRIAEYASWDKELLSIELEGLQELNFDLDLTGFETAELEELLFNFATGTEEEQGDLTHLEDKQEKTVCCPQCGEVIVV